MGARLQVRPPAGKLRRAKESEKLGENFLFETTLGNYSETNQQQIQKQILSRDDIYLTDLVPQYPLRCNEIPRDSSNFANSRNRRAYRFGLWEAHSRNQVKSAPPLVFHLIRNGRTFRIL